MLKSHRPSIIIIDATSQSSDLMRRFFEMHDYDARVAPTAMAGLKMVQMIQPLALICDSAITDMDWLEVARIVHRGITKHRPLLVSVGVESDFTTMSSAVVAGFDVHIPKPVDIGKIADLFDKHMTMRTKTKSR